MTSVRNMAWVIDAEQNLIHETDSRRTVICTFQASMMNPLVMADASLIAAAPDLLAACKAVAGVFADYDDMPLYARKCIAASAKAEGRDAA